MTREKDKIVRALMREYGKTFAEEIGISLKSNTPAPLFQLLCASLLFSARIRAGAAVSASKALFQQGWTTAEKMAAATWAERTKVLNRAGYARYDERTSTMLGDTAEALLSRYGGDLRRLREEAGREPSRERGLLKQFKGIGDVGADIFFREVQLVWEELVPFADGRALEAAHQLGLGEDAKALSQLVSAREFARLVTALVRVQLADGYDHLREAA